MAKILISRVTAGSTRLIKANKTHPELAIRALANDLLLDPGSYTADSGQMTSNNRNGYSLAPTSGQGLVQGGIRVATVSGGSTILRPFSVISSSITLTTDLRWLPSNSGLGASYPALWREGYINSQSLVGNDVWNTGLSPVNLACVSVDQNNSATGSEIIDPSSIITTASGNVVSNQSSDVQTFNQNGVARQFDFLPIIGGNLTNIYQVGLATLNPTLGNSTYLAQATLDATGATNNFYLCASLMHSVVIEVPDNYLNLGTTATKDNWLVIPLAATAVNLGYHDTSQARSVVGLGASVSSSNQGISTVYMSLSSLGGNTRTRTVSATGRTGSGYTGILADGPNSRNGGMAVSGFAQVSTDLSLTPTLPLVVPATTLTAW